MCCLKSSYFVEIIMLLEAWIGGPKLMSAASREYFESGTPKAICALVNTAIVVQATTFGGFPITFNGTIIASVIESGLVSGKSRVSWRKIGRAILSSVLILFASLRLVWTMVVAFVA